MRRKEEKSKPKNCWLDSLGEICASGKTRLIVRGGGGVAVRAVVGPATTT